MAYSDSYGSLVSTKKTTPWQQNMAKVDMGLSAGSAVAGAIAAWAQAKREKKIAKQNAKIAEQAAQDAQYRGRQEQMKIGLKQAQVKGTQRAAMAANGVALDSQTAIDLQTGTDWVSRMDATTVENNARREAYASRLAAANYQAQAASISPGMSGFGSLLEGAGTVAQKWYQYDQAFGSTWRTNWFSRGS